MASDDCECQGDEVLTNCSESSQDGSPERKQQLTGFSGWGLS